MSAQAFELLSAAARYWFALLGALILLLAAGAVYRSARSDRRHLGEERPLLTLRLVSDADKSLDDGYRVTICEDGLIGRGRICDARVKHKGLARKHAAFKAARGGAVTVMPIGGAFVAIGGEQLERPRNAHVGDSIQLGPLVFTLETGGVDIDA